MITRYCIILVSLLSFFFSGREISAAYIPAPQIVMTGVTLGADVAGRVRFDIAPFIVGYEGLNPRLDTSTKTFTGGFYAENLGWFLFQYAGEKVSLDCAAQSLDALSDPCILTGTGWSELFGTITFSDSNARVEYLPDSGVLSGSLWSELLGEISLDGVYLPLRSAILDISSPTRTHHLGLLSVSGATAYGYTSTGWTIELYPLVAGLAYSQVQTDDIGVFSPLELTIAGMYRYSITDPSGSVTTGLSVRVYPSEATDILYSPIMTQTNLSNYCGLNPLPSLTCPDGATPMASTLSGGLAKLTKTEAVGDGVDTLDIEVSLRDRYGNPLMTQVGVTELSLSYDGVNTHSACQIQSTGNSENPDICMPLPESGISLGGDFLGSDFLPTNVFPANGNMSPRLILTAIAPTSTNYMLRIDRLNYIYTKSDGGLLESSSEVPGSYKNDPTFLPAYSLTGVIIDQMKTGSASIILGSVETRGTTAGFSNQKLIHALSVGDGLLANSSTHYETEDIGWICTANIGNIAGGDCNWISLLGRFSPTLGSEVLTVGSFQKRWMLTGAVLSDTDPVYMTPIFTYSIGGKDVAYYGDDITLRDNLIVPEPAVRILGVRAQSNTDFLDGMSIGVAASTPADMKNLLRRNAATLSRNRTNYTDAEYFIHSGSDLTINSTFEGGKRTIIVIGGDVIISDDILPSLKPRAIIALVGENGKGGNVLVHKDVQEIESSIFTERSLLSGRKDGTGNFVPYVGVDTSKQLYIKGSIMSENTLGGAITSKCPRLIDPCTPEDYDLEKFRATYQTYDIIDRAAYQSSAAGAIPYPGSSLIIEYDPRILSDVPPALSK